MGCWTPRGRRLNASGSGPIGQKWRQILSGSEPIRRKSGLIRPTPTGEPRTPALTLLRRGRMPPMPIGGPHKREPMPLKSGRSGQRTGRPNCAIGWAPRKRSLPRHGKAKIGHARRLTPHRTRRPRYGKLLMFSARSAGGHGLGLRGGEDRGLVTTQLALLVRTGASRWND